MNIICLVIRVKSVKYLQAKIKKCLRKVEKMLISYLNYFNNVSQSNGCSSTHLFTFKLSRLKKRVYPMKTRFKILTQTHYFLSPILITYRPIYNRN